MDEQTTIETMEQRAARVAPGEQLPESLVDLYRAAHEAGVSDEVFGRIVRAMRVARGESVVLPAGKYEGLSRGRGWARQGHGSSAVWGERESTGYRVGAGRWSVGSTDGFKRKDEVLWTVSHVTVGAETWTIAD